MTRFGLARNTTINLGAKGFGFALSLFVSASIVHHIGLTAFGFWAIISTSALMPRCWISEWASRSREWSPTTTPAKPTNSCVRRQPPAYGARSDSAPFFSVGSVIAVLIIPQSISASWPHGWQIAVIGFVSSLGLTSIASVFQAFPNGLGRWVSPTSGF